MELKKGKLYRMTEDHMMRFRTVNEAREYFNFLILDRNNNFAGGRVELGNDDVLLCVENKLINPKNPKLPETMYSGYVFFAKFQLIYVSDMQINFEVLEEITE